MSETEEEESRDERYADVDTSHLDGIEDGCGCTEVWEHTSSAAERSESEAAERASGSERSERHESSEREAAAADEDEE